MEKKKIRHVISEFKSGDVINGVLFIRHIDSNASGSHKKAVFQCTVCKNDWEVRVDTITRGSKQCQPCFRKTGEPASRVISFAKEKPWDFGLNLITMERD